MMKICFNDKLKELPEGITLEGLIGLLGINQTKGWAFAVNESIIPKNKWNHTVLSEGDNVLLIQATQGG